MASSEEEDAPPPPRLIREPEEGPPPRGINLFVGDGMASTESGFCSLPKNYYGFRVSFGDSRQFLGREGWGKSEGQTENTSPMMLEKPPF